MRTSGKYVLILVAFLSIVVTSCQKDIEIPLDILPDFNPTPYELPPRKVGSPQYNIRPDNPLTEQGVMLGRMLFYDPILSSDSTQSCASCHNQVNAFTDNERAVSIGVTGAVGKRNSMALFNLMWHPSFFWDGRSPNIRHQVIRPIEDPTEMNSSMPEALKKLQNSSMYRIQFYSAFGTTKITEELYAKAMEQFLFTLISFDSESDKFDRGEPNSFSAAALRGKQIFFREPSDGGADCFHCHGTSHFADFTMSNNGLDATITDPGFGEVTGKPFDLGKFKVVSLRNVAQSAPYMHDGRFKTLEEVIDFYSTGVHANSPNIDPKMDEIPEGLNLTAEQKADLIEFLKSLSDQNFLTNPKFSNPFN